MLYAICHYGEQTRWLYASPAYRELGTWSLVSNFDKNCVHDAVFARGFVHNRTVDPRYKLCKVILHPRLKRHTKRHTKQG